MFPSFSAMNCCTSLKCRSLPRCSGIMPRRIHSAWFGGSIRLGIVRTHFLRLPKSSTDFVQRPESSSSSWVAASAFSTTETKLSSLEVGRRGFYLEMKFIEGNASPVSSGSSSFSHSSTSPKLASAGLSKVRLKRLNSRGSARWPIMSL